MNSDRNTTYQEEQGIDLARFLRMLRRKWWILVLTAIVAAGVGFVITAMYITPKYSSTFTVYVNNHNNSDILTSLNSSDLSARQTLANTTAKIANSDTVLRQVAETIGAKRSDLEVKTSVDSSSSILTIRAIMADKDLVFAAAKELTQVLTEETARIIEGSSLQVIDSPRLMETRYSPSYSKNLLLAAAIGFLLAMAVLVTLEARDNSIKDMSELEAKYHVPVIGTIPDAETAEKQTGSYYRGYTYQISKGEGDEQEK